jgi:hypothetical protein
LENDFGGAGAITGARKEPVMSAILTTYKDRIRNYRAFASAVADARDQGPTSSVAADHNMTFKLTGLRGFSRRSG